MACVFCNPEDVVVENDLAYVVYDKHPVSEGHLLVIPKRHLASFFETSLEERKALLEMLERAREHVIYEHSPQGFNIGINISRCAGAGLPGHVHLHLVPRWDGDTNFMATVGQIRVISQALDELYEQLTEISQKLNLPTVGS